MTAASPNAASAAPGPRPRLLIPFPIAPLPEGFEALKIGQEAEMKFGFLLDALKLGCPPHGGIALGLDRLVMMRYGIEDVRWMMSGDPRFLQQF